MTQRSELFSIASMLLLLGSALVTRLAPGVPEAVSVAGLVLGVGIGVYSVVLWRREQAADASTRALSRVYLRDVTTAMLAYLAATALSVWLLRNVEGTALRAGIALLPVAPIALALRATARYIRGLDEMQRRIELEAVALGSLFVAFAYLTAGFLQGAKVIDVSATTAMLAVLPALSLAYAIAKRFVLRHYG